LPWLCALADLRQPWLRAVDNKHMKPSSLRLFAHEAPAPERRLEPTLVSLPIPTSPAASVVALEAEIIAALEQATPDGEPKAVACRQKEHAVGGLFAALSVADARALYQRLAIPKEVDRVARGFGRLASERRARLLAFLGDARRRAALSRCR